MLIAIGFVILASVSLTVVINGLRKAPEGYEDENGFQITSRNYSTHKRDKRSGDQGELSSVNDGVNIGDVVIPMCVLVGDVNGSSVVTVAHRNLTKGQALKQVTGANFRMDATASGNIPTADTNLVKSKALGLIRRNRLNKQSRRAPAAARPS